MHVCHSTTVALLLSLMDGAIGRDTIVELAGMPAPSSFVARDFFESGVIYFRTAG
jgi:hypothetical protein